MTTGIITVVASILSLVAGYFIKKWVNQLLQKYYDWDNQNKVSDQTSDASRDQKKLQDEVDKLQNIEDTYKPAQSSEDGQPPKTHTH